jgi:hypothetical protein
VVDASAFDTDGRFSINDYLDDAIQQKNAAKRGA